MKPTIEDIARWWDFQPCNVKHSPMPVGTWQWSREVSKRKYFVESHIIPFAQFPRWYQKRVLEIGCGIGTDTLSFAIHGAMVDACDLSVESISLARQRASNYPNINFYVTNAEEWLPARMYDLVYSFGMLHHTPNPEKVVAQVADRLRPNGEFRFMVYAKWSWKSLMGYQPEAQAGCPIVRHYTAKSIRELLGRFVTMRNGQLEPCFEIVRICKRHIFPWKIEEYKRYRYVKEWWWELCPPLLFKILERLLGHHLLVTCKLRG